MKTTLTLIMCLIIMHVKSQTDFCASAEVEKTIRARDSVRYDGFHINRWQSVNEFRRTNPSSVYLENPYDPLPCENCLQTGVNCAKAKFVIPIVVHIVYNNSTTNINPNQITNQIERLNEHFSNKARTAFPAVNTGIQFVLANKDINGNTISGITTHNSTLSNHKKIKETSALMQLGITNLPMSNYLHIWVVADIQDSLGNPTGIKGYSTMPGSYFNRSEGVVIRYDWIGDRTTYGNPVHTDNIGGNTLTHEVGHYLGLLHPFDGGCAGLSSTDCSLKGDHCCDVPAVLGLNSACSNLNTCTETYNNNPPDLKQNYMDYTTPSCRTTFTPNQTEIMQSILLTYRQALWQPTHINRMTNSNCLLSATFSSKINFMCKNLGNNADIDSFTAYNISGAGYQWKAWRRINNALVLYKSQNSGYVFTLNNTDTGNYTVQLKVFYNNDSILRKDSNILRVESCGTKIASYRGIWEFGQYAGLGFYAGGRIYRDLGPFNNGAGASNIAVEESSITMSDSTGNLAFYGSTRIGDPQVFDIYGGNYLLIRGGPIKGFGDGLQQAVTFPAPGIRRSYFLIHAVGRRQYTISAAQSGYNYSIIKIDSLNRSLDSVTYIKNKDIRDSSGRFIGGGEAVTAIRHCNNRDYWVLCKGENDTIYRLLATTNRRLLYRGYFKCGEGYDQCMINPSPDGKLLSIGRALFKFNRNTGVATLVFRDTSLRLGYNIGPWGSGFSTNGKVLYRSAIDRNPDQTYRADLFQYDLESSHPNKSRKTLPEAYDIRSLQNGPDGRLYLSVTGLPYISVFNQSNNVNTGNNNACGFQFKGPILSENGIGGYSDIDLPNFANTSIVSTIKPDFIATIKNCTTVELLSNQACTQAHRWFFGNGDSSHVEAPTYTYGSKGTYSIKLIIGRDTVTRSLVFDVPKTTYQITGDILSCDSNQIYEYKTQTGSDMTYAWSCVNCKNSIPNANSFETRWKGTGKVRLTITDNRTSCVFKDSLTVNTSNPILNNTISNDTFLCKGSSIIITGSQPSGGTGSYSYSWFKSKDGVTWETVKDSFRRHLKTFKPDSFIYYRKVTSNCSQNSNLSKKAKFYFVTNNIVLTKNVCLKGKIAKFAGYGIVKNGGHYDYYWQYSTNNVSWSNDAVYNGYTGTDTSKLNKFQITVNAKLYIRRKLVMNGCESYSNVITIVTPNSIRKQPLPAYVCHLYSTGSNANFKMNVKLNKYNSSNMTFVWQVDNNSGGWISLPVVGGYPVDSTVVGSNNFSGGYTVNSTTFVRCLVIACGDTLITNSTPLTFTTSANPTFSYTPRDVYTTIGTKAKLVAKSTSGNIQWQKSTDNGNTWTNMPFENDSFIFVDVEDYCQAVSYPTGWNFNKTQYRVQLTTGCKTIYSIHLFPYITKKQVIVRDYTWDFGKEPSDTSIKNGRIIKNPMISPDIAISYSPTSNPFLTGDTGRFVNTDYLNVNYVWVRVKNRGTQTSLATKMDIHWSMASSGLKWPQNWLNNARNQYTNPITNLNYPLGGKINTTIITVPAISAGATAYIMYKWDTLNMPKPNNYVKIVRRKIAPGIYANIRSPRPKNQDICLLARMPECTIYTQGMSFPETLNTSENCRLNNKIAAKHRMLTYAHPLPLLTEMVVNPWIDIRNAKDGLPATVSVRVKANDSLVANVVDVVATLDSTLSAVWASGGSMGAGFTQLETYRLHITDVKNFRLDNIVLDTLQIGAITFDFYIKPAATGPGTTDYTFEVWQTSNLDTMPEGFVQMVVTAPNIQNGPPNGDLFRVGVEKANGESQSLNAYPNPTNNDVTVNWTARGSEPFILTITDVVGKVVYSTVVQINNEGKYKLTIPLNEQSNGVYTIQVSSDGFSGKSQIVLVK